MKHIKGLFFCLPIFLASVFIFSQDTKLDPSALAQVKARDIGPAVMSGRVTAIDAVNKDTRIFYVGAANGGVWKTVNGGITFQQVFTKQTMSVGCLTVDQSIPDIVWVGTGECNVRNSVSVGTGLYRSLDSGKNWELLGFADSERIARVLVHPQDSNTIYVGVMGHLWNDHPTRGVYLSHDGGKNWQRVLYVDEKTGCADLAMDPRQPEILYAAMWQFRRQPYSFTSGGSGSGLYKSLDGGKTWKKIQQGLPAGELGRIAIAPAYSKPERVYALVEARETGLYRSDNRGDSWAKVNTTLSVKFRPFYFSFLCVDPADYQKLFVSGLFFSVSENGGNSFSLDYLSQSYHSDVHPIWIDPHDPRRVIIGTDGGVYLSDDGGRRFRFLANLPLSQFYHVAFDLQDPYNVYGGLQDNSNWYGPARSLSGTIGNGDWVLLGGGDGFYAIPHATDPDTIYYTWQGGKLVRFNRRTKESKDIQPLPGKGESPYRFNWNAGVAVSPNDPEVLYVGGQYLFRSRTRGDSWEKISPDLTTNDPRKLKQAQSGGLSPDNTSAENYCTIVAIAESPLERTTIWAGTDDGNLQLTRDGGKSWENLTKRIPGLPPNTWCPLVEAGHFAAGTAYVVFDGHRTGDMKSYVYRTGDYGKTWSALASADIRGYCHVIREDLVNQDLLFLGSEFGLFLSLDRGKQWLHLKDTVPQVAVNDLAIHPREHDLIIATHGLGAFILDDLTPLRNVKSEVLRSDIAVLPSRPSVMRVFTFSSWFSGDAEYFGANPFDGACISYYLKKRHIFGDMKLEVYDSQGKLVKALTAGKGAGLNRVYWDMRYKPPKTGPNLGGIPQANVGPMVAEGVYTVRLSKGDKTASGEIRLIADPLTPYPTEVRQARYDLIMKLYRLLEDLGYVIDAVSDLDKQAETLLTKVAALKDAAPRRMLAELRRKLAAFRKPLIMEEGLFVENRLKENVLEVYTAVMSYGGRPTDSQMQYSDNLSAQMRAAEAQFSALIEKEVAALNIRLPAANQPSLKVMTRKEYDSKE